MQIDYLSLSAFNQGTAAYTHVHEIVSNLRELGAHVDLHVPNYPRPTRLVIKRAWKMLGLQIRLAWKWIAGSRPDVLYMRHHYVGLPITIVAYLLKIPIVVEVNGPVDDFIVSWSIPPVLAPLVKRAAHWQARLSDWAIAVTPGLAESLVAEYGLPSDHISLIPNGVNTDLFRPIADPDLSPWPALQGKKYVIFVGALSPWQGIETMLEACVNPQWPEDIKLVIAGDGLLQKQITQKPISHLIYLGSINYERIPDLISGSIAGLCLKSDMHARSGLSPLKLYEYAACARPVIVTDLAGLRDFVERAGCGLVVPSNDPLALCEAVRKLAEDPALQQAMGAFGVKYVFEGHSWRDRAGNIIEILDQIEASSHTR